ncbi:hypothetical protein D1816_03125 [Aquimarina sp. AD10]|uniref:Hydrolase n=1 Tax=Aquimarina aggregata TaxID=1642818 RepID=A0A163CPC6_9FLAO|nr:MULTISPECIES: hypothetical protein [Aquimarina]AXT59382.1 hypothetical protein D1816_03125 [Aquimarina sp. AD10]KZS42622.1 hypothetical protein AWE51_04025 [Aquimarina aggregata]RKM94173.1 hypothetical protein D7033_18740 [Aquimarina sp. AD10]
MKSKIFLYLFIFTALFVLFQFMNAKKAKESYDAKIENLQAKITTKETVIDSLVEVTLDQTYFSLESNEDAAAYFEELGYEPGKLALTISDQIIGQNKPGKDNPIVPFAGMEGSMAINKVRLLNHRWIIADFTDGVYWGELFISYEVRKDGVVDFEVEKSFLYPKD